jgi:DNA repair protein RecN (Recombination protein N)
MLVELRIRDYAVIEDLTLRLGPGLNVLTGETGAGKSIIVGALSLLLGERASSVVVRAGADRATVEAAFEVGTGSALEARVEELGFRLEDGLLILRREVATEGRNRAWVNGSPATAGVVGELGRALVDLHGQHEHQTLLRTGEQRAILDAFGGAVANAAEVEGLHARCRSLATEVEAREQRVREIESRMDYQRFQLGEIDAARLAPGEDEELEAEARRREHAEELVQGASGIHETLYAGDASLADQLADARSVLHKLARFDASLADDARLLDDAFHGVQEVGRHLGEYAAGVDHDPRRLEEVRRRQDLIFRLKRKYGPELADVLATGDRLRGELAEVEDADHDVGEVRRALEEARHELAAGAGKLTALREKAAMRLSKAVSEVLPDLGLPEASFDVRLKPLDGVGSAGAESVEFLVSPNPGFEPMPLARIASGGELSRVMLAVKSVLADVDRVPVLVFDEIDAGIGGVVAGSVAAKLAEVAFRHQVFVVTHLPQLASRAAAHLLVEKEQRAGTTLTRVRVLEGGARVEEIARMLGGDPESATSQEHAREMLGAVEAAER